MIVERLRLEHLLQSCLETVICKIVVLMNLGHGLVFSADGLTLKIFCSVGG